jgi:transcriptional regulator with PAS, ATPase and Fis domain
MPLEEEWERVRDECRRVGIITRDKRMLQIFRRVKKAARSDSPVLILGESGTGKELIARAIHDLSNRHNGEFVVVPTIQENLVESELFGYKKGAFTGADEDKQGFFARADGGTIFLDEVGEITPGIQVKLLRVLNSGEYSRVGDTNIYKTDARVVAATNRDLKQEMQNGNFREDLYFRLNVIPIELPPLRERRGDIELLANHFIEKYSQNQKRQIQGLSQKAVEVLTSYDWPGNIRELENVIERAVALTEGELITETDLDWSLHHPPKQRWLSPLTAPWIYRETPPS